MRSLRARLLYRTTAVLVLTFVVAACSLYVLMWRSLWNEFDTALLLEVRSLATHVESTQDGVQIEPEVVALPEYSIAPHAHFYQLRTADGRVLLRSRSLAETDLVMPAGLLQIPEYRSIRLPGHMIGRSVAISFQPHPDDEAERSELREAPLEVTLVVARETASLNATLARLSGLLLVVTVAATVASVWSTRSIMIRELQPLGALAQSIEEVSIENLAHRIRISDCPVELAPVVACLNQMLGRLDGAIAREKSFAADVAHELRTPLAGLETTLEVCASRPRDSAGYQAALANCLAITRSMHVMVDNLLRLARAEAQQDVLKLEPVALEDLIRSCWLPSAVRAAKGSLHVEWSSAGSVCVLVDAESTRQILTNVFDNAVSYTPPDGELHVTVVNDGTRAVVTIANNGCRLAPADVPHVFDRFWRGDASRTDCGEHCGLGLSLCRRLAELQQGSISAEVRAGWFYITLTLLMAPLPNVAGLNSQDVECIVLSPL